MHNVPTYVIEKNQFFREGIKGFLLDTRFTVLAEYGCSSDLDKDNILEYPSLIIMGVDHVCKLTLCEQFESVRILFPNSRVVLMFSQEDVTVMPYIILLDADGYIFKNVSSDAFINYLNLILIGEKVLPASLAHFLKESGEYNFNGCRLSEKEINIIKCLTLGYSNKLIAQQLLVAEATIKVHLKTIQRKLDVHNRTQVALWAVNNGLSFAVTDDIRVIGNDNTKSFLELVGN